MSLALSDYLHPPTITVLRVLKNIEDKRQRNKPGRKITGYTYDQKGNKIPDEMVKEYLCELIAGDGYPYGYKNSLLACRKITI